MFRRKACFRWSVVGLAWAVLSTPVLAQEVLHYSTWGGLIETGARDSLYAPPVVRPLPPITAAPFATPAPTAAPARSSAVAPASATAAPPAAGLTGHAANAIRFYGGNPNPPTPVPRPQHVANPRVSHLPVRAMGKPFQNVSRGPTVSPYLNLYRQEDDESAPNYFAFVRPQLEQQDTNSRQRNELQRLRRQVHRTAYGTKAAQPASAGLPTTGHRSRFLNTGHYYGGFAK